jgi:hypothetical protein
MATSAAARKPAFSVKLRASAADLFDPPLDQETLWRL